MRGGAQAMYGITGIMTFGGRPVDMPALERMTATLAHRGPDAQGVVRLAIMAPIALSGIELGSTSEARHIVPAMPYVLVLSGQGFGWLAERL